MTQFTLEIIPGTLGIVKKELLSKFPGTSILQVKHNLISFESELSNIDDFRELFSPLRIKKENGLVRNLFRREWRKEYVPAGINPALGYILCDLADITQQDIILDPFCGGGTIAISAALYFHPEKVLASDISGTAVDITLRNFAVAGIKKNQFAVFRSNVSQLKIQENYIDKIITNLPFGVRVGNHEDNKKIYKDLAKQALKIVKQDGYLIILTQEKELVREVFRGPDFKIGKEIVVDSGKLKPSIFQIKKIS